MVLYITFGFILLVTFAIMTVVTRPAMSRKSMQHWETALHTPSRSAHADSKTVELVTMQTRGLTQRLGDYLQRYPFSQSLQRLILHAGSTIPLGQVVLASAGSAVGCALLSYLFLGLLPLELIACVIGAVIPFGVLRFKRARRLKAFGAALPDAIDLMARALRAGHSMGATIEMIAEQSPEPLSGEFGQVFQQQRFGLRFRDALLEMGSRVPSKDLHFLITAILVQRETGGDLTEILDRTSHVIRERVRIEGEVRVYTAQGRLTGWILGLLPVIMLGLINMVNPGYSSILFHDPTGQKLLYAGGTLIIFGGLIIRQIVDIQV